MTVRELLQSFDSLSEAEKRKSLPRFFDARQALTSYPFRMKNSSSMPSSCFWS